MSQLRLGVIGYGKRIRGMIKQLQAFNEGVMVAAIVDPRAKEIRAELGAESKAIRFYDDHEKMLAREDLNGVAIGTRCSLHAQMASAVAKTRLPLFLEKPVAITIKDVRGLGKAFAARPDDIVVSFPLRLTSLVRTVKEIIDSGLIGSVEHVQAYNNVPYGDTYYMNWYRDEKETGGLFLQKATHDFDYINYLLGERKPIAIAAMASKQIYRGEMPAGLKCDECPKPEECMESPFNRYYRRSKTSKVEPLNRLCGFAEDTGNEDSSSALIRYDTGMHVSYSQNFFARNKAGTRGARLLGYKGTVEFDWYTNQVRVLHHHAPRVTTHAFDAADGHGGGDKELALNFIRIMQGRETSRSPLQAGLLSAWMCLKARASARTGTFQELDDFPGIGKAPRGRPARKAVHAK